MGAKEPLRGKLSSWRSLSDSQELEVSTVCLIPDSKLLPRALFVDSLVLNFLTIKQEFIFLTVSAWLKRESKNTAHVESEAKFHCEFFR